MKEKKLPVLRIFNTGRFFFFNSTVSYTYNHCAGTVDYSTTGIIGYRVLIKFLTVYTCITFHFFAMVIYIIGKKDVIYSYKNC